MLTTRCRLITLNILPLFALIFSANAIAISFVGKQPTYTQNISAIQQSMGEYSYRDIESLILDRHGNSPQSFMRTLGWHTVLEEHKRFQLTQEGLVETTRPVSSRRVPDDFLPIRSKRPKFVVLEGSWKQEIGVGVRYLHDMEPEIASNILGESGYFVVQTADTVIQVPLERASPETLAYYGAVALTMGDVVEFPPEDSGFPIWAMSVGKDYVNDYIMSQKAGGWYLEWHNDRPHFHMPLSDDAGGAYLLAKKVGNNEYHLTAFRIPFGTAVFTKRGAIHCDAGLTGKVWIVGYTTSQYYSTVLLRNAQHDFVNFDFFDD